MVFPGDNAGEAGPGLAGGADAKHFQFLAGQVGGNTILGVEGIQAPVWGGIPYFNTVIGEVQVNRCRRTALHHQAQNPG